MFWKRKQKKKKNKGERPWKTRPGLSPACAPALPPRSRASPWSPFLSLGPTGGPERGPQHAPSLFSLCFAGNRGPHISVFLLLPQLATEPDSSPGRFNPGNSGFPCPFRQPSPYKASPPKPQLLFASKSQKSSPRRPSEARLDLTGADLVLLRGARTSFPLGPNQARRRVRGEFLSLLVLSVSFLAQGFASSGKPGELRGGGHGGWPRRSPGRKPAGRHGPLDRPPPLDLRPTVEIRRYDFAARFAKEPLEISLFNPPSFTHFRVYVFHFSKRILVG